MAVNPSALGVKPQIMLGSGLPAVGAQLFFYVGGSVNTKQNTYTDSTGGTPNTNPIVLNSLGEPNTQIWMTVGQLYKVVYAPAGDTDPPTSPIWTIDNLSASASGVSTFDEWVASGIAPTYVNATTFTLPGDQTSAFQVGRRLKTTITAGTGYHTITASVFGALTTVTVNGTSLDNGLSAVSYGILSATNPSIPATAVTFTNLTVSGSAQAATARTAANTVSALNNTVTTLVNLSGAGPGMFLVFAYMAGAGSANYTAKITVLGEGTDFRAVEAQSGAALTIAFTGSSVTVNQTSGVTQNVSYSYLRIL